LLARNNQQILTFELSFKCLEFSAHLAADGSGGAGRKRMAARVEIKIEENLRRVTEEHALLDHRCHKTSWKSTDRG
jgi:hypothetical protein